MDGLPIDIIIFAAIAAFIVLRLRGVLGRRTGNEQPPPKSVGGKPPARKGNKVVNFPDKKPRREKTDLTYERAEPGSPLEAGLNQIRKLDKDFNADEFLSGASAIFETIIEAFAAGDMEPVAAFLSEDVHENFSTAARAREKAGETLDTTIIGINRCDVIEARTEAKNALVTVKFVSEQVNVTRSADGKIIDGDPDTVNEITDIWTFSRNTQSRDPNWALVETRSSN